MWRLVRARWLRRAGAAVRWWRSSLQVRARKAVVRKGRENYLCLLNYQEAAQAAQLGNGDLIGLGLAARWIRATRDGDKAELMESW